MILSDNQSELANKLVQERNKADGYNADGSERITLNDFEFEEWVLRTLAQKPSAWEIGAQLQPDHFEDTKHQCLFKLFKAAHQQAGCMPSFDMGQKELKERYGDNDKTGETCGKLLEALQGPLTDYDAERVKQRLREFLKKQRIKLSINSLFEKEKRHGIDAAWEEFKGNTVNVDVDANDSGLMDLGEFWAEADKEVEDWLIPGWLEAGCLHLFSAAPKAGKTSTVCSLVASLLTGQDWFGFTVVPSPVLFLPFEGKKRFIRDNIRLALGGKDISEIQEFKDRFHAPISRIVPVTGQWLRKLIAGTKQHKGVVLIDSARACFSSGVEDWENKASEVRRVMNELTAVALETGWAIIVIHHNNREDSPSGSTDWRGASDYVWTMCKEDNSVRKISIEGRLIEPTPPFAIRKRQDGTLERTDTKAERKKDEWIGLEKDFVAMLGLGEENKKPSRELMDKLNVEKQRFSEIVKAVRSKSDKLGIEESRGKTPASYWWNA